MKAYVIMPYGGASAELKRECDKIYKFLLRNAIENYDHNVELIRQDYTGEGGHVLANVIENLSAGDIVIADISGLNWNVAYELGIRHSLSKSGTILLCDDKTELPFDIRHMNIIIYSRDSWMDEFDAISERIVKAIENITETGRCDSPVHMCFPALPETLTAMLGSANQEEQQRIADLVEQNQRLKASEESLRKRLIAAGLDPNEQTENMEDLSKVFSDAVKHRNLISDAAVDQLRVLEHDKNYEEFAAFLADVLKNGYLDEIDCRNVYGICRHLGIPEITKKYIEIAVSFYPDNEELQGFLADEFSRDYRGKDRAQSIVNEMIGVRRVESGFELTPKLRTRRMLSSFFNVYLHLKKYSELIEIGKLLLADTPAHSAHILKNIAMAAKNLQQYDLSYAALCSAVKHDPADDTIYKAFSSYYTSVNNPIKAYEAAENAVCLDSSYDDYYYLIAGLICDDLNARTASGQVEKISPREKERYAFPFILQTFLDDRKTIERAISFLKKNRIDRRVPQMIAVFKGDVSAEEVFSDVDMSMVEYCCGKRSAILAEIESLPDEFEKFI